MAGALVRPDLLPLWRRLVAEEAAGALRHALANVLHRTGNATALLRRALAEAGLGDAPAVDDALALLGGAGGEETQLLGLRLLGAGAPRPVAVRPLLERLAASLRDAADVAVTGDGPAVAVDAGELELALVELVTNALAAARRPPARIELVVVTRPEPGLVGISVRDGGRGFSAAARERAFEPFAPVGGEGAGLGLAIVRRVAMRAGGWAELGEPVTGADVTLVLPAA